ncbi:beta-lactamase family protein [Bombilactobacillus folatiphilus]|uniref:Beta-lactamase family protein n=1 Tax=Bombilactobacillus folatiphilus TaxID=2923362 RepID=A0ABY4PAW7_9LACO|nr:serine hydrolase domain-containing protein [Bombilactobacillus folatiphilus]UQS82656.1 beta-lactamase family protein [Bombilactobacillus folatiphilus]
MVVRAEYLCAKIKQLVNEQVVPGVSFAFITPECTIQDYYGANSWQPSVTPLKADQLYDLASLTKVLGTTTLLLHLIEQGQLQWKSKVADFLPYFQDSRVTITHLMTHTSGIRGYIPHRDQLSAPQLLRALQQLPVTDEFEQVVRYTDTGPILAGLIIEQLYQKPVQTVIAQQILQPLKLPMATFKPDPDLCVVTNRRAGYWLKGQVHDPKAWQLGPHCGSSGLFASVADLLVFTQWFLGQTKTIHPPIQQTMIDYLFQDFTKKQLGRSFGWDLRLNCVRQAVLYHTGFTGNFWLIDKQRQRALIVLSNRVHPLVQNQRFFLERDAIVDLFLQ